ncbi:PREDICTED: coiled-coil domain-containing protein 151-like [Priapulus caudatus]|uniref:Coiled-coil domain-containing protein 151-like n=1 Tax=Priapulus caudatus TaxID=37621 RepID=A0ABM1F069_PRICU|nr:PREDICTED: coiled-coil domain-containing protein 151-like [Priapulus caudatus]
MPAGSSYAKTTPCARTSIQEQCVELQRKLQLLDGGRKAMYESAQITTRRNKEQIALLRQQVKNLREHLAGAMAGDEEVIKSAFKNRYSDGAGMKRKTGKAAITAVDEKVCDSRKKLNALIHMSAVKKKKLNELQTRYREMQREVKDISAAEKIESKDTTKLKEVENRQDKIQLKLQEAERIQRTYQQIQSCLEQLSCGDRITTEFREHLSAEIARRDKTVRQTEEALILFVAIKSGIENLTEKLQLVESPEDAEEKLDRCSVDYPVQLLGSCRDKLARVLVDISEGEEQAMGEREMQEELVKTLESSVPHSVSRAKLLTAVPSTAFNDDDDSGEEVEVLTRAAIKKQAQVLASMKVKKGGRTPRRQR